MYLAFLLIPLISNLFDRGILLLKMHIFGQASSKAQNLKISLLIISFFMSKQYNQPKVNQSFGSTSKSPQV